MRKLLFALLILLTWYLAAMFRADTLMISAVLELLIFLSMPIFVHYLKRNMKVCFGQDQMTVNRGRHVEIPFLTDNTGMLPVRILTPWNGKRTNWKKWRSRYER